jgi:hypothetical protein
MERTRWRVWPSRPGFLGVPGGRRGANIGGAQRGVQRTGVTQHAAHGPVLVHSGGDWAATDSGVLVGALTRDCRVFYEEPGNERGDRSECGARSGDYLARLAGVAWDGRVMRGDRLTRRAPCRRAIRARAAHGCGWPCLLLGSWEGTAFRAL